MSNKWVSALTDLAAGITTFPMCVGLSDLNGDGEYKLIIGDIGTCCVNMKLKVYKGLTLIGENSLAEVPAAVVPFNNEHVQPTLPSIAVTSGPSVLVYKNLKPFYKFNLPSLDVNDLETEAWKHSECGEITEQQLFDVIDKLRKQLGANKLSARSQTYLLLSEDERSKFIDEFRGKKLTRQSTITCMTTLKKSNPEKSSIDSLIVGTESGMIYCIDTQAFTILSSCLLPAAPVFLCATGIYDVDYRIFVACRGATVYSIKRGVSKLDEPIVMMNFEILGMVYYDRQIILACLDNSVSFFTLKGKRQNIVRMKSAVRCIDVFTYEPKQYTALLVAVENEVHLYSNMTLVDRMKFDFKIAWIKFGEFGREESALIIGTEGGGLAVKLFRRTAKLNDKIDDVHQSSLNIAPKLNIPKRTKLFVDQTLRERECAQAMHQAYQRDLFMMRLSITRAYAKLVEGNLNSVSTKKSKAINMTIEINGFGPTFRMIIKLRISGTQPIDGCWLFFVYDNKLYEFDEPLQPMPTLVPKATYIFDTWVTCLHPEKGVSDDVRVLLTNQKSVVVGAVTAMPISELELLD